MFACCASPSAEAGEVVEAAPAAAEREPLKEEEEPELAAEEPEPVQEEEPELVEEPEIACFPVTLDKQDGQEFGLSVDAFQMGLQVLHLKPDCAAELYNARAPEEQRIQVDDFIVAANGKESEIYQALKNSETVKLIVARPEQLQIRLERPSKEAFGLDTGSTKVGTSVLVKGIKDGGVVAKHNSSVPPEQRLLPQDLIKSANGQEGPKAVLDELKKEKLVELVVLRLPQRAVTEGGKDAPE